MSHFRPPTDPWPRSRERRLAPRYPLQTWVTLRMGNGAVTGGFLEGMSTVGGFLRTRTQPFGMVEGEEGVLCFSLSPGASDAEHRFSCEIPRVCAQGVAVRFLRGE
ncbi:MAG: PilZ domain-containing protein [Magnetococcales bacterium]|nr:PilZ domain-containing protein [Magnetococcales bacterium]